MHREQIQRVKILLEIRQHELRLSIEHHLHFARRAEPESDIVDQAVSEVEKEFLL